MKILIALLLIVFGNLTFAYPRLANAAYGDMDTNTCQPSGVVNNLKAKIDPKTFWINMYLDSIEALDIHTGKRSIDIESAVTIKDCDISYMSNPIKHTECITRVRSTIYYWKKCNQHAQTMCIKHGGLCY